MYHNSFDTYLYCDYKRTDSHIHQGPRGTPALARNSRLGRKMTVASVRIQPAGFLDGDGFGDPAT
jgi:hypothetical protein